MEDRRSSSRKITPAATRRRSSSFSSDIEVITSDNLHLLRRGTLLSPLSLTRVSKTRLSLSSFLRSLLHLFSFPAASPCSFLSVVPSTGNRKVTGTLFGHRKGHVTFAVQDNPRADPLLLIQLAVTTTTLIKEMSSGLVRIALECESKGARGRHSPRLVQEQRWTMYCNGKKWGYAEARECGEYEWRVLSTVRSVTVGAGVMPVEEEGGHVMYMRARFERVVGSRDSEAFYMLNPEDNAGPDLSIFLLRL